MFELPSIMINFKTYTQASGKNAEKMAIACQEVAEETGENVSCCVQTADIHRCSTAANNIPILGQHLDIEDAGGHTGKVHIKALDENGASGCLINHSEDRVPLDAIQKAIGILDDKDMISVVCVKDEKEARTVAKFGPDIIAIEPPELIGGDVSVTSADPEIISRTLEAVEGINKNIPVLCGAGVKTGADVKKALELGSSGVLVASGVTKASNQKKAVKELVDGIKQAIKNKKTES
ncbi:MAG: triose-phosphate isomerase [Candidatus Woesearchaeota archaeon]